MNTGSAINYGSLTGSTTGTGGSIFGNGGPGTTTSPYASSYAQRQNSTVFSTQADYPIGGGRTLVLGWQLLDTRSPEGVATTSAATQNLGGTTSLNTKRSLATVGVDFKITDILGFTLNWNLQHLTDRDNVQNSYSARSLSADMSAHF